KRGPRSIFPRPRAENPLAKVGHCLTGAGEVWQPRDVVTRFPANFPCPPFDQLHYVESAVEHAPQIKPDELEVLDAAGLGYLPDTLPDSLKLGGEGEASSHQILYICRAHGLGVRNLPRH